MFVIHFAQRAILCFNRGVLPGLGGPGAKVLSNGFKSLNQRAEAKKR